MKTNQRFARSRWLRLVQLAPAALALLCTGCAGVYVSRPIGDKPLALNATEWDGTWLCGNDATRVRVTDADAGRLQLIEAKVHEGVAKLEVTELVFREAAGWQFVTILNTEKPDRLEWARIKRDGDQLLVWLPQKDAFRALVQSGRLHGQLEDKDVLLAPLTATEMTALTSGALGVPFAWDEPIVLRRLAH